MIWYLPRWSIVLAAILELICNGFFIFENPFIVGTSCFTLRIFSIAAIVINASLQGYKLRHRVNLGSVLLPDESAHIVRIEEADNILRPKVRVLGCSSAVRTTVVTNPKGRAICISRFWAFGRFTLTTDQGWCRRRCSFLAPTAIGRIIFFIINIYTQITAH